MRDYCRQLKNKNCETSEMKNHSLKTVVQRIHFRILVQGKPYFLLYQF